MLGTALGTIAAVLEAVTGARWLHLMRRVRIPADRRSFYAAHGLALLLGIAALALGASRLGTVLAAMAVLGAAVPLALAAQAQQARVQPVVGVGGPIIDFVLPDHAGRPFDLASLRGRPFLLKFFRGHW